MIMKIMGFDIEVDINKDKTNILVIDDHKLFGSFCYDLNKKDTEKIVFIDNDKLVNIKDIIIFNDILSFNFNDKTIITKLYNKLSKSIISNVEIDNELKKYMNNMFEWIKDMNWPGAFDIYARIKRMNVDCIMENYIYAIKIALKYQDINWLDYLSGLIENPEVYKLLPEEYQKLMTKYYNDFWKE